MRPAFFSLLASAVLASPLVAQTANPSAPAPPAAQAAPRSGNVNVDGRLDEPAWRDAPPIATFIQREPVEGVPADAPTEVRVLFDTDALYVGITLFEDDPSRIADQLVRRDEFGQYDFIEVSLDPVNDRRTGYQFRVSAAGVQGDSYLFDDVEEDESWDAVWASAVHRDERGWSAEIRIPLSQIRYRAADTVQAWGVNFTRRRLASNEISDFALQSRVRHGRVSVFGRLEGLRFPHAARRLEFRPYAVTSAHVAPAAAGDPFFDGSRFAPRTGLDFRYGLGTTFSLDGTIAPDFGQVEVDPAVINLTAFETFFPEKRPFFVEDARIFDFTLSGHTNRLFYSRRVGREPRGDAPSWSDFADVPNQTTILGAAKLTGRMSRGFSVGALAALTGEESGRAFEVATARREGFTAEPRAAWGVARARQDLRDGASQFGGIVTAMRRDLPADGSFDFLTTDAYSAGVDFEHNWGGSRSRNWALWGFAAASLIRGSPQALLRVQRASNHYFQRPDATRVSLDSTATAMHGREWRLQFERRSAEHWTGAVWLAEVTPGFEINDAGFSTSGERLDGGARIEYQQIRPGRVFRSYDVSLFTFHNFRHEALDDALSWASWRRAHKAGQFSLEAGFEFLNYWELDLESSIQPRLMSDVATRGGPLMVRPSVVSFDVGLSTDRRRALAAEAGVSLEQWGEGGGTWEARTELTVRPSTTWEVELSPAYSSEHAPAQYVTQTPDPTYAETFGRRYLFGELKRRELSMDTRVNMTLSPTLTFQLYAQPLLSAGDYVAYKQLAQPETFDFDVFQEGTPVILRSGVACLGGRTCVSDGERYVDFDRDGVTDFSFDEQDFTVRSLRLNAVLRWEYRPGSALYLVWQQGREIEDQVGRLNLGRDLDRLWDAQPDNVFIVKLTYWLGL
ncbi:MAG: carbohydrate binding family 9 domain-containing protein [Gemmatimonadetes bacterium]|nr:carbohydrate binding family 9 domain-containing protein [Gemmatimonadota bacterium]